MAIASHSKATRPPLWKVWFVAARPHTLTASLSPVIVGYALTFYTVRDVEKGTLWSLTAQWASFCMLVQLGTNLHNDYADFVKGADTDKRLGQARATQKGWLTPAQTAGASTFLLFLALVLGLSFISLVHGSSLSRTYSMVFIVTSSIFNAFAYTGGPWPLGYIGLGNFSIGYSGLGDLFVFLYFGLVATLTLPFLYLCKRHPNGNVEQTLWKLLYYAIPVATLATNIIVVNNLRDRHTDVHAHKRTLAVRLGATFCKVEFVTMIAIAYGLVVWDACSRSFVLIRLLPLLSFPLARKEIVAIYTKDGSDLNPHVGGSAKVQFLFCILMSISLLKSV